jgi:hypothetical protein
MSKFTPTRKKKALKTQEELDVRNTKAVVEILLGIVKSRLERGGYRQAVARKFLVAITPIARQYMDMLHEKDMGGA